MAINRGADPMTDIPLLRHLAVFFGLSLALGACAGGDPATLSAVGDVSRPAVDQARDADRKPAKMLAFARVRPGETVVDFLPGKGYFTRLFSTAVGPAGAVYAVTPQLYVDHHNGATLPSIAGEPGHENVHDLVAPSDSLALPVSADMVWTSQNYHDIHVWGGPEAAMQLNRAVFKALNAGGLYIVLDHAGPAGLDEAGIKKLHRIDEAMVIREVEAAGFEPDGESDVLRNPADPHTANVFDPSIRGKTDQFLLRFRKPRK
jgi:predicted methyltransferase